MGSSSVVNSEDLVNLLCDVPRPLTTQVPGRP